MAALIKHVLSKTPVRCFSSKIVPQADAYKEPEPGAKIESLIGKIQARGFLRHLKEYAPPADVSEKITAICERVLGKDGLNPDYKITNPDTRFKLFAECFNELKHGVPNSLLYTIKSVEDLHNFYKTPVDTTAPYEVLKQRTDLPPNLYLQPDYIRFNPETDTMFKGQTAFPKSSTFVSGLRTRKKYKGFITDSPYPDVKN